jgi:hypothetical protein
MFRHVSLPKSGWFHYMHISRCTVSDTLKINFVFLFADTDGTPRKRDKPAVRALHTQARISRERAQTSIHALSGVRIPKARVVQMAASPQSLGNLLLPYDIARKYSTSFFPFLDQRSIILAVPIPLQSKFPFHQKSPNHVETKVPIPSEDISILLYTTRRHQSFKA